MKNRNAYVLPMTLRHKRQVFDHVTEPRGGTRNESRELLDQSSQEEAGTECLSDASDSVELTLTRSEISCLGAALSCHEDNVPVWQESDEIRAAELKMIEKIRNKLDRAI